MKKFNEQNYYIRTVNTHLINLLEENYYIELGVVNISVIEKLLQGQILDIREILFYDLLNTGTGQISQDPESEFDYQLHYLLSLRQKSSTNKFFLTMGTLTYLDEDKCEKYAPIVLIPIEIDYITKQIVICGSPLANRKLIKMLSRKKRETIESQNHFLETYTNVNLSSVAQIDQYMLQLVEDVEYSYSPSCFLTICEVEYYDITIENNFFTTERSRYEVSDVDIVKSYFENAYSILPTNIDQKYIMLKVLAGDSFCVDGRLGSGKTHTILNIMANAIKNNQCILYINQDLDNILDVEKNLKYLGFEKNIYNLTKSILEIDIPEMENLEIRDVKFNPQDLIKIQMFQEGLDERINGYEIRKILEKLAVIKNLHLNLIDIPIHMSLEKYEIELLYKDLKKTEQSLKIIENYDQNIWKQLNITHNNITTAEIIEKTNKIYDIQFRINREIVGFCNKFNIRLPKDINDLSKLINHIMNFNLARPLSSWKDNKTRSNVIKALGEIQYLSDENYNTSKYYEKFVCDDYNPGRSREILKELCGKTIKISNENDDNIIFLDYMLSNDSKLPVLIEQISINEDKFRKFDNRIDSEFGQKNFHKNLDKDYFELFYKLYHHLTNYYTLQSWANDLVTDSSQFLRMGAKVKMHQQKAIEIRNKFQPYLVNETQLRYEEINSLFTLKKVTYLLKKYFDQKKLKKSHLNFIDLINDIKEYYETIKEVVAIIKNDHSFESKSIEALIDNYVGLYDLVVDLPKSQLEILKTIFKRQLNSNKFDFRNLTECLEIFVRESREGEKISEHLTSFNIYLEGEYPYQRRKQVQDIVPYLNRVIELKAELTKIFRGKKNLTSADLLDLVKIDEQYLIVQDNLKRNEPKYKMLLGDNYHGFDTVIGEVGQALEHFNELVIRLDEKADIDNLFSEPTLSNLIEDATKLNTLWSEWITCFRNFSFCFKGGKNILQTNSFDKNMELLTKYLQSMDQINHIIQINETIKKCLYYKFDELAEIIKASKIEYSLADSLLYAILTQFYYQIKDEKGYLLDFNGYVEAVDNIYQYEVGYCQNNINYLQHLDERKTKGKLQGVLFDNYEEILSTLAKSTNVFLADVNIFNSNIKLNRFDLVIIDDGHLSSANKYNRINECKQCVIFGDKSFQSSYVNSLMQRINDSSIIKLRKRYIKMTPKFNNVWSVNNCYIYNGNAKIYKQMVNSIHEFVESIMQSFLKDQTKVINVVVGDENTRREVYENLVKILETIFTSREVIQILSANIRIVNAISEGAKYVNDVIIFYNDFAKLEQSKKELIFRNFIVVSENIYIYYIGSRFEEENNIILKNINTTIGRSEQHNKYIFGISSLLFERLKATGISIKEGLGFFDIVVEDIETVGVMIVGNANNNSYSLMDDYRYYFKEYQKNKWKIKVVYVGDLIDNFESIVEDILSVARGKKNETK